MNQKIIDDVLSTKTIRAFNLAIQKNNLSLNALTDDEIKKLMDHREEMAPKEDLTEGHYDPPGAFMSREENDRRCAAVKARKEAGE